MSPVSNFAADTVNLTDHPFDDGLRQLVRLLARQAAIEHSRLSEASSPPCPVIEDSAEVSPC